MLFNSLSSCPIKFRSTRICQVSLHLGYAILFLCGLCIPPPILSALPQVSSQPNENLTDASLVYVSDYFSFIGKDDQGHVAFALDNNRGRDGESHQAEHFVVLHDESKGWVELKGNGSYDNIANDLIVIPDSSSFQFQGYPEAGVAITSQVNDLTLTISPISKSLDRVHDGGELWMGSASAVLEWKGRKIQGRVIYEYLMMPNFNRLTRTYWGLWKNFQGLYLSLDGAGDLYVHSQQSEKLAPLVGELDGFVSIEEKPELFQILQFTPLSYSQGLGFYRWPMKWALRWFTSKGSGEVQLEVSQFHRIANWVIGGFAMGIVQGEVTYQGQTFKVYGLVELIM